IDTAAPPSGPSGGRRLDVEPLETMRLETIKDVNCDQLASIAAALVLMQKGDHVWGLLAYQPNPRLRSAFMRRLTNADVPASVLAAKLKWLLARTLRPEDDEAGIAQALTLVLGHLAAPERPAQRDGPRWNP